MDSLIWVLLAVVLVALAFDYVNGFHDAANAIATVVSTRALSPRSALVLAGALNFAGAFAFTGVARTMGKGLVQEGAVSHQEIILAALIGAIAWNLLTWWWGLPSSSSHALVGGLVGAVCFHAGWDAVKWGGIFHKVVVPGILSPVIGLAVGFLVMAGLLWLVCKANPFRINKRFKVLQVLSASMMAFSHGTNDAQKVMGIITLALVSAQLQTSFEPPIWVKFACALMIALGTAAGGWRIIKTMGSKMVKLQPIHGFAAETTAATVLMGTSYLGFPVSTTHVISAAIMGVGATRRISAVRWGVAGNIMMAWILTIPAAALMGGLALLVVRLLSPGF
ncbi:MAG: inorganic phosphate transporter [Candidatus Eremiobacterota bacterium]